MCSRVCVCVFVCVRVCVFVCVRMCVYVCATLCDLAFRNSPVMNACIHVWVL